MTKEKPTKTNLRLSLENHSYFYPLGIAENVLIEVANSIYPVDFAIVDIEEDEHMPLILGTPFLATAKATIKCGEGVMVLKSGKIKVRIPIAPRHPSKFKENKRDCHDSQDHNSTVRRKIIEWEEKIGEYKDKEIELGEWKRDKPIMGHSYTMEKLRENRHEKGPSPEQPFRLHD